ncbi:NADPH-dependent 2,4-dienoyl-CoA reductase/sulfur reductase-like enzyme [Nocardioides soli]|uniref:NADPH-dependent 2,4-dienoyl-CoA reductase/sulfur reductase-like enzyme n=2 Tax=Nocardioides soli TaxID=1036020 RepID=A0A7W4VX30_9ACTN|nr:NADPH-dependent 2,4-dienoyl-CoA reductase/sulfur reductase-like enzyme [Nocardioides soli]
MPHILSRALPPRWSDVIAHEHRQKGVQIRISTSVRRFVGDSRVRAVELDDGELLEADAVVVGIGMEPAVELGRSLELKVDGGILVDEAGRTSRPRVFASGDVTIQPDVWTGSGFRRLESFQNAQEQSDSVAAAILDQELPKRPAPWFWSDQYELNIQTAGVVEGGDDVVVRGSVEDGNFCAFHIRHGRLVGTFAINRGRDVRVAMRMMESGVAVVPAELADTSNDLRRVVARQT